MALVKIQQKINLSAAFEKFYSLEEANLTQIKKTLELSFNLNESCKKDRYNGLEFQIVPLTQEDVLDSCINALIKFPKDPNVKELIKMLLENKSCEIDPQNITLLLDRKVKLVNGKHWLSSNANQQDTRFLKVSLLGAAAFLENEAITKTLLTDFTLPTLQLELPLGEYLIESFPYEPTFDTKIRQKREREYHTKYITPETFILHTVGTPVINELFTKATKKLKTDKPAEPVKKVAAPVAQLAAKEEGKKVVEKDAANPSAVSKKHSISKKTSSSHGKRAKISQASLFGVSVTKERKADAVPLEQDVLDGTAKSNTFS